MKSSSAATQSLISIGLPVFNGANYLRQALDSLLAQTYAHFEVIISDNASTDDTAAICQEYIARDHRIRYIRQSTNAGPNANFNFVLDQAIGRYFMWAAADDEWDPRWIEVLIQDLTPDVAIAFGHVANIDAEGKIIRLIAYRPYAKGKIARLMQYFFREENNGKANLIYGVYRTDDLKRRRFRVYGRCGICWSASDMLFVFDHAQDGRLSTNASVLLRKRLDSGNAGQVVPTIKRVRQLMLFELVPYFVQYVAVAKNPILKVLLLVLIPIKYLKALLAEWLRVGTRFVAIMARMRKRVSADRERV